MARMVHCRKYQKEMEGLESPPFPGPRGLDIFDNVSKQAWQEWLAHQTMLVNEKRLNMMEPSTRVYLTEQMGKFLNGEEYDAADGYVPPSEGDK
ncbi:oxidative damage protection protein [Biformimicrobium ophioploci]|uniref:Probable Fe(2+)-trafficking protein n=1 Tax=Biformimicrobium ophioploci TaxID=3036711 RepID=A0ABQ6LW10_9GAMM|nr:oxidative damage protection protein [Microbulbifer sp. NKW57]GMG86263.1 oxidative damage protection protein [Microbulbifer sp. NKW57]